MSITGAIAQLRTTDLDRSIRFWVDAVGLSVAFRYEDFYAGIDAGAQIFHLKLVDTPDPSIAAVAAAGHFHLYLATDDAAALAARLAAAGIAPVRPLHDTPWRTREIVIRDDQGHTIHIGEVLAA